VVVGGGYAGATIAQALDSLAEVRLVEPRDRFLHNVATIRAVADVSWLDRVAIPYDRLLKRGTVIHDKAVEIRDGMVRLSNGTVLEADVVVAATGSTYAQPFKPAAGASVAEYLETSRTTHRDLLGAEAVTIVGAGPVGIELAGEIAAAHPGKKVRLVSALSTLLPAYPTKLGLSLARQLEAMHVELALSEKASGLGGLDRPQLDATGRSILFPAVGARPTPPPIANLLLSSTGRVLVDQRLRVKGLPNVFIVGDAAETGDPMTSYSAHRQAAWLIKTLKAVLANRDPATLRPYAPMVAPALFVPLGPKAGAGVLPITRKGWVVGSGLTARIKGRDLFVSENYRRLGYRSSRPARPSRADTSAVVSGATTKTRG
jgi:NADH dehydrogenase FAD-containing subunit